MEQIIKNNRVYSFTSEYNETEDLERKKKLFALIEKFSKPVVSQNNLEKFNQMLNKIEVSQTKKPFHRLNEFQKEKLVKAYVSDTYGENESYVKIIMDMIKNKLITSSNIEYLMDEFKLQKIKNIEELNGTLIIKPKKTSKQKEKEEVKKVNSENEELDEKPKKKAKAPTKKN